jgi:hypothetical protein
MSDTATEEFRATDALPAAREAANSDEVLRAPRLAELEANAISGGTDEDNVRAATDEIRKRRKEQGQDPWDQGEIVERSVGPETRKALKTM